MTLKERGMEFETALNWNCFFHNIAKALVDVNADEYEIEMLEGIFSFISCITNDSYLNYGYTWEYSDLIAQEREQMET